VTNDEVNNIIERAADVPHEVDPAVMERVSKVVLPSLQPVRPLQSPGVIALGLQTIFLVIAIFGATFAGNNGFRVLSAIESILIFGALSVLARLAASSAAAEMIPGSKRLFEPRILLAICSAAFVVIFPILFYDYRLDRFFSEGISCLLTGVLYAAITGGLIGLVIRRGLILDPIAAGVAVGTLSGLTGLGMLELHCPILKAMHLMIWHTAVIPFSGLAGYLAGKWAQDLGTKRKEAEFMQ
jgi:hypothetical protein